MQRQRGFTIVEFIIAISIGVILVSVGIPRYNTFIQKQQFISQVNVLAGCLQETQRFATAPPLANAQFFSADIVKSSLLGKQITTCTPVAMYQSGLGFGKTPGFVGTVHTASQVLVLTDTITGKEPTDTTTVPITSDYKLQIIYSALHGGNPVQVQNSGSVPYTTLTSVPPRPQAGFSQKIDVRSNENDKWHATIAIDRPGTPVTVTFVEVP